MSEPGRHTVWIVVVSCALWLRGEPAFAHCDTMDGPIVPEARQALQSGDVTPLLKWVRARDEAEVRRSFKDTRAVRGKGRDAQQLADQYFFETLIRLHRQGEGAPYTGLRAAGSIPPIFKSADAALDAGSVDTLADEMAEAVRSGIKTRFERALAHRKTSETSVARGRQYVAQYVEYMHFVEGVHELVQHGAPDHHFRAEKRP